MAPVCPNVAPFLARNPNKFFDGQSAGLTVARFRMDAGLFLSLLIIFGLILLNGFFAGAEIAVISLRKSRTQQLIEDGDNRARIIRRLQNDPDTFFATVQIGVTLVGAFNGVFAGNQLAARIAPIFVGIPYIGGFALEISVGILVISITYLSLVFGELVPKSLAHHYAERFALAVAYPLAFCAKVFRYFTRLLTVSSNIVLRPFKDRTSFSETRLTAEEILQIVEEGVRAGTIQQSEHELIENVLEINQTAAREVMIPRVEITSLPKEADEADFRAAINAYFSRIPVIVGSLDNILGILHIKDLMRTMSRGESVDLPRLVRPAYYVPDTMPIGKILPEMQKRKIHMAIVVDEYGGTAGLLTMEDILEEIVGEIDEIKEDPDDQKILASADGSFSVSGTCSIIDFNEYFELHPAFGMEHGPELPESDSYTSVAGYVIKTSGRFPEVGEKIPAGKFAFELVRRVRQKLVLFRLTRETEQDAGTISK